MAFLTHKKPVSTVQIAGDACMPKEGNDTESNDACADAQHASVASEGARQAGGSNRKGAAELRASDGETDAVLAFAQESGDEKWTRRIYLAFKIYGALCIAGGGYTAAITIISCLSFVAALVGITTGNPLDNIPPYGAASLIIAAIRFVLNAILAVMYIMLGWRLLKENRHRAGMIAYTMIALVIACLICDLMLEGTSAPIALSLFNLVMMIVISVFVDPSLVEERSLQSKLRDMEARDEAEAGGRDETGRGYITLNFFNLFWLFIIASIGGLIVEDVFRLIQVGIYEDRAGVLYGPFSPIYGFGAVLMTLALNRFYRKNPLIIFAVSALIGGAFEYFVSWFLQFAFGITAWNYSGPWFNEDGSVNILTFMNIDGRTSLFFMIMWGLLGVVWIKVLLPVLLRFINKIPWNWRYVLTTVCASLMIADGAITLIALDCWYERVAGNEPVSPIEQYCAEHYGNDVMENRFQTMGIDANSTTRTDHSPAV